MGMMKRVYTKYHHIGKPLSRFSGMFNAKFFSHNEVEEEAEERGTHRFPEVSD